MPGLRMVRCDANTGTLAEKVRKRATFRPKEFNALYLSFVFG